MRCISEDDKLAEYWVEDAKVVVPLCAGCAVNAELQGYQIKTMKGSVTYEHRVVQ